MLKLTAILLLVVVYSSQANLAEGILEKYLKVIGSEQLKSKENWLITADAWNAMTNSTDELIMKFKGENAFYVKQSLGGKDNIFTYDGTTAWGLAPMMQMNDVTEVPANMLPMLKGQFDQTFRLVKGLFLDYKTRNLNIEFLGKEEVDGKTYNKLKISDPQDKNNTQSIFAYFDKSTNLISKMEISPGQMSSSILFKEFKKFGDTMHPSVIEVYQNNQLMTKLTVTKIDTNPKFDANTFAKPKKS